MSSKNSVRFTVENLEKLRAHGVEVNDEKLKDWIIDMRRSPCRCGKKAAHCCPFSVIQGEVDFGVHLLAQLLFFQQHRLLGAHGQVPETADAATQTVHEYCSSGVKAKPDGWPNDMLMPSQGAVEDLPVAKSRTIRRRQRRKMQKLQADASSGNAMVARVGVVIVH